ncbi:hypothetical protein MCUN1_001895 [Malassezia cuniculi]|uniref:Cytosol aminopeptidase domain-containing protein n=1 Tax=Malassezia cuniculi TaxID=948313 RepID=A0AAF0EYK4_9BASI|nr:hypothetical protein MCUN1_001895 [Malassezia cuniculi]
MAPVFGKVVAIGAQGTPEALQSDAQTAQQVSSQWKASGASADKANEFRLLFPESGPVAALAIGKQNGAPTTAPDALPSESDFLRDERLERSRLAAGKGVRAIRDLRGGVVEPFSVGVDSFSSPHAAATGANLGLWSVNHLKTRGALAAHGKETELQGGRHVTAVPIDGAETDAEKKKLVDADDELKNTGTPLSWWTGEVYARAQNWARELQELPSNIITPTAFAERVSATFKNIPNTQVIVRDEDWARSENMNLFLSVAHGSDEPLRFVEVHYRGAPDADAQPLAIVGKGITFDTGGISIKPGAGMDLMRADMGGAAVAVSTVRAIAELGLPINVVAVTPLTENMPSGHATKPGDIFVARNGLTVQVDNTDAEGRLILADAISYASDTFKPHTLLDVATLTGAAVIALGDVYSAVFTENDALWKELKRAGEAEHDLHWRMPLTDSYLAQISKTNADLVNTGGRPGGSCTAAIFLKQFVHGLEDRAAGAAPTVRYAHIDIAGSMEAAVNTINDYQSKGLTGRPVRALVEFARRLSYA